MAEDGFDMSDFEYAFIGLKCPSGNYAAPVEQGSGPVKVNVSGTVYNFIEDPTAPLSIKTSSGIKRLKVCNDKAVAFHLCITGSAAFLADLDSLRWEGADNWLDADNAEIWGTLSSHELTVEQYDDIESHPYIICESQQSVAVTTIGSSGSTYVGICVDTDTGNPIGLKFDGGNSDADLDIEGYLEILYGEFLSWSGENPHTPCETDSKLTGVITEAGKKFEFSGTLTKCNDKAYPAEVHPYVLRVAWDQTDTP